MLQKTEGSGGDDQMVIKSGLSAPTRLDYTTYYTSDYTIDYNTDYTSNQGKQRYCVATITNNKNCVSETEKHIH